VSYKCVASTHIASRDQDTHCFLSLAIITVECDTQFFPFSEILTWPTLSLSLLPINMCSIITLYNILGEPKDKEG
jgi:hypothetical protein